MDMWCSLKQKLRSVSSGKEGLSCAELLERGFRFGHQKQTPKKRLVLKLLLSKDMAYCSPFNDIVKSPVKGPCEEDGWTAGAILPQLKLRVC